MKHEPTITNIIVDIPVTVKKKPTINSVCSKVFVSECANVRGYSLHNNMAGRNITNCKQIKTDVRQQRSETLRG